MIPPTKTHLTHVSSFVYNMFQCSNNMMFRWLLYC